MFVRQDNSRNKKWRRNAASTSPWTGWLYTSYSAFLVFSAVARGELLNLLPRVLPEALEGGPKAHVENLLGCMSRSRYRSSHTTLGITRNGWSRGADTAARFAAWVDLVAAGALAVEPELIALAGAALGDAFGAAETTAPANNAPAAPNAIMSRFSMSSFWRSQK
jgi:hypothetical protein